MFQAFIFLFIKLKIVLIWRIRLIILASSFLNISYICSRIYSLRNILTGVVFEQDFNNKIFSKWQRGENGILRDCFSSFKSLQHRRHERQRQHRRPRLLGGRLLLPQVQHQLDQHALQQQRFQQQRLKNNEIRKGGLLLCVSCFCLELRMIRLVLIRGNSCCGFISIKATVVYFHIFKV